MTETQVRSLRLGIEPINDRTCLTVESAILWVNSHTTLDIDPNSDDDLAAIAANVKMFLIKYFEIMELTLGVTSESISGLSQSFNGSDITSLLWEAANELLGDVLLSQIAFYPAKERWN